MFQLKILDIDLTIPMDKFEERLKDEISNYSYGNMLYNIKNLSSRFGKNICKITINNSSCSEVEIIAEKDTNTNNIHFYPMTLRDMSDGFYDLNIDDDVCGKQEDPSIFLVELLRHLCVHYNGLLACISSGGYCCLIKNGNIESVSHFALIDNKGNVYSGNKNLKAIKGLSDDNVSLNIQKPIGEWIKEHPDIQEELQKCSTFDAKANCIGKYLISAKLKEDIDSDEFIDIFCQAGAIGFSEPSILNIYKLII